MNESRTDAALRGVATLVALASWAALAWRFNFVCDDAFISFRYARNLVEGLGLGYNPGLEPPVEGYTNFLWVLWCAVFEALGVDVTVGARLSSAACGAATLLWVIRAAERSLGLAGPFAALPALLLAALPPFAVWSTSGLDTLPFTLALFATWERLLGDPARPHPFHAAAAGVLAALLRADGAFFVGLILGLALLRAAAGRQRPLARGALVTGAFVGAAVALHVAFRLAYYGDLLPNTAHAKVSFSPFSLVQGRNYVVAMALSFPALVLVPLMAIAWMAVGRRATAPAPELTALVLGTAAYFAVVAGGDFMPMARLLVPALPFVAVLALVPLRGIGAVPRGRRAAWLAWPALLVAISLPPAFGVHVVPDALRYRYRFRAPIAMSELTFWQVERDRTLRFARIGRELARLARPGETFVGEPIGAIGYYSRLGIYDSYGLVTREVALREVPDAELRRPYRPPGHHKKVPLEFFLPKRPDYLQGFIVSQPGGPSAVPGYRAVYHRLSDPADRSPQYLYLLQREDLDLERERGAASPAIPRAGTAPGPGAGPAS